MAKPSASKPNYLYSIISVTLVLLLLGVFGLVVLQGAQMVKHMKEQVEIIIELKEGSGGNDIEKIKSFLAKSSFYKKGSVEYVSKEDGARMMQDEFGDAFLKLDMANPLYDVLTFNVNADFVNSVGMEEIKKRLEGFEHVNDVFYQESVADAIAHNLKNIGFWILGAGVFFLFVAIALILNTIRLALYSNRFLIKNMELVGASWGFISKPFLIRSFWHGLLCGTLAIGVLSALIYWVFYTQTNLKEQLHIPGVLILFGSLLFIGIFLNVFSTYFVVNKYLKMRVDDLY